MSRLLFETAGKDLAWIAEGGQDRDGPLVVEGTLLSGHEVSRLAEGPGGGRQIHSRPAGAAAESRARLPPGSAASGSRAQVGVDLAGDVPLQAAEGRLRLTSKIGSKEKAGSWFSPVCPVSVVIGLAARLQQPGNPDLPGISAIGRCEGHA